MEASVVTYVQVPKIYHCDALVKHLKYISFAECAAQVSQNSPYFEKMPGCVNGIATQNIGSAPLLFRIVIYNAPWIFVHHVLNGNCTKKWSEEYTGTMAKLYQVDERPCKKV